MSPATPRSRRKAALPDPRSGPAKQAALVQAMFDRVAPRYDLANTLFSLGRDRRWRAAAVAAVAPRPGEVLLDVAAGTGRLAAGLAEAAAPASRDGHGGEAAPARVLAVDFSWRMLRVGAAAHARAGGPALLWCTGDARALPLPNASVDAVTIGFGLRNLPDPAAGLAELARVTQPGGRLVILEFSHPSGAVARRLYEGVLARAMPVAARAFTADPDAYRYLAESIRAWPDQRALAQTIADAGWQRVQYRNLTGGVVALHRAWRPAGLLDLP